MPRRPRHIPHQSKISVQDVNDYATPQGAAMANEEMRRIKAGLDRLEEQLRGEIGDAVAPLARQLAGAGNGGSPLTKLLEIWNRANAEGQDTSVSDVFILDFDDQGQTSRDIPITFDLFEVAPGHARLRGWAKDTHKDYTWFLRTPGYSLGYEIHDKQYAKFIGGTDIIVEQQGPDITISSGYTLSIFDDDMQVGPSDTKELNFDSQGATTTAQAVNFEVFDDAFGRRTIRAWVQAPGGGGYTWTASDGTTSEVINSGDTVIWEGGTNMDVTYDAGTNTFTITNTYSYSWELQANGGLSTTIDSGETVNFIGTGAATVSRSGNDITIDVTVGGYSWTVSDGSSSEVIATGDTVIFAGGTNITTTYDTGTNTLTIDNTYSYSWELDDNSSGLTTTIVNGGTVDIIGGTNITVTRVGGAVTINADPYPDYDWTASDGSATELVTDGETITWTGTNGVDVTLLAGTFTIDRPLTLRRTTDTDTVNASTDSEVVDIYFENDVATKPAGYTKRAWVDVTNPVTGRAKIEIWYEDLSGGGSYDWDVAGDTGGPSTITSGSLLNIVGGTDINTVLTGTGPWTLTINNTYTYDWDIQADTGGPSTVGNGVVVDIAGGIGVDTTLTGAGPFTVTIDRPLTLRRTTDTDTIGFSTDNAINDIYFENDVAAKPVGYTKRAWVDVTNPVAGRAKIEVWYEDLSGGGAYDWDLQADTGGPSTIGSGAVVDIAGGVGVDTTLAGAGPYTVTIDRPLTLRRTTDTDTVDFSTDNAIDDIYFENSVGTKPAGYTKRAWIDVTNPVAGRAKIEVWYEDLGSGGAYDWTVSDGSNSEIVASGDTIIWAGGTDITTSYDVGTNTMTIASTYNWELDVNTSGVTLSVVSGTVVNLIEGTNINISRSGADITISADPYPDYNWLLAAEETAGTANITDGITVTFRGEDGITARRDGNDIIIGIDDEDPPWGNPQVKRRMTGFLEFATGTADIYGGAPAYYYGVRRYIDIVHNWNLSNMNDFHLELVDVQLNDLGALTHYRNSDTYPPGLWSGAPQTSRFVNRPHWAATDRNTIRVYTTMTEEDTTMKFRYVLTEE